MRARPISRADRPLREVNTEPADPLWPRLARPVAWLLRRLTTVDWDEAVALPARGGVIVVPNHISDADPPLVAHYLIWSGRWPRFLAKASLWRVPVLGRILVRTGQIPVLRRTSRAREAEAAAQAALTAGHCVVIYPEGTVTKDPGGWPMAGHLGAARLALRTGAPVLPLGQWGAHRLSGILRLGRPRIAMRLGDPVELSDLRTDGDPSAEAVAEATARIMTAITAQVAGLRGRRPR